MKNVKSNAVELKIKNGIAWLVLNRSASLNALNLEAVEQFAGHMKGLRDRKDVRVVVTRGEGRAFCAGSDVRELAGLRDKEVAAAERRHAGAFTALDTLPQPTIAMLHGYVLGGGLGLALYHDFRIATTDAVLGLPEVKLGWTPPWAMGRLAHVTGHAQARWLAMTGRRISGEQAFAMGLVNEAVPAANLMARVLMLAENLKEIPAGALAQTKQLLNQMSPLLSPDWDERAAKAFEACYATPEAQGALGAFLARKKI